MKELPEPACKAFLGAHRVGVLSLARSGDAYAIPLFYVFDGASLYFHSKPGEKDAFLAGTHEGCLVVMELEGDDDWTSVQVTGRVERLTRNEDAERAFAVLAETPLPPEFGVAASGNPKRGSAGMSLWRLTPRKVTGRQSKSLVRLKGPGGK